MVEIQGVGWESWRGWCALCAGNYQVEGWSGCEWRLQVFGWFLGCVLGSDVWERKLGR